MALPIIPSSIQNQSLKSFNEAVLGFAKETLSEPWKADTKPVFRTEWREAGDEFRVKVPGEHAPFELQPTHREIRLPVYYNTSFPRGVRVLCEGLSYAEAHALVGFFSAGVTRKTKRGIEILFTEVRCSRNDQGWTHDICFSGLATFGKEKPLGSTLTSPKRKILL